MEEFFSALAKKHQLYLVASFPSVVSDDSVNGLYNAAFAFDKNGLTKARYRKFHLYAKEPRLFDCPKEPDVAFFDTEFGLRVGMMICFDINFEQPGKDLTERSKIDVLAYPTAWYDELPFLTAINYHNGWAVANDVKVLTSGYHYGKQGSLGSGIYDGRRGIVNYVFSSDSMTKIVTETQVHAIKQIGLAVPLCERFFLKRRIERFQWKVVDSSKEVVTINLPSGSTCTLTYELEPYHGEGRFVLVAQHGHRIFGLKNSPKRGIFSCGVFFAKTFSNGSFAIEVPLPVWNVPAFKNLSLTASCTKFLKMMPTTLSVNLQPLPAKDTTYTRNDALNTTLKYTGDLLENLYSFGLVGRDFEVDERAGSKI